MVSFHFMSVLHTHTKLDEIMCCYQKITLALLILQLSALTMSGRGFGHFVAISYYNEILDELDCRYTSGPSCSKRR